MRRVGQNRWRVTIERKGTKSYSALGEDVTPWVTVCNVWARRHVKSAKEELSQGVETAVTVTQFFMRNLPSVTILPNMRLLWGTHTYNIREVIPTGPADSELMLVCTEVL